MKKIFVLMVAALCATIAQAQAVQSVKEAGKATAETVKEGAQNVAAVGSSEPNKSIHKAKAKVHKAKAHAHAHAAKADAKAATN